MQVSGEWQCKLYIVSESAKDRKTEIDRQIYRAQISGPVLLNKFLTCILVTQLCIMYNNTTVLVSIFMNHLDLPSAPIADSWQPPRR